MITFILALVLIKIALVALILLKTYFYLTPKELKRQAAHHDELARTLFSAASYGGEAKLLLWLITGLAAAGGVVLFSRVAPPLLGFIVVALVLWFAFLWIPRTRLTPTGARVAVWCTPTVVWILRVLHPIMQYVAFYAGRYPIGPHTRMYEREDMLELIELQASQRDNRISDNELELMRSALQFGDLHVRDIAIPRKQVVAVDANESVGPVLLDELHKSGHAHFPVYEGKTTNIVGVLAIDKVADISKHGSKIQSYCDKHLAFLHESDNLAQALKAFYDTKQRLFIVIDNANDYVGIITLDDVLRKLAGTAEQETYGNHEDRKAVAGRHTHKQKTEPAAEKSEENVHEMPPEVLE